MSSDQLPPSTTPPSVTEAPLSDSQRGLWLVEQLSGGDSAYHLPIVLRLVGSVSPDALRRAVHDLAERHDSLRTVIVQDGAEPIARLKDSNAVPFEVVRCDDASSLTAEDPAAARIRTFIDAPFDLSKEPPLRVQLLRLSDTEHLLAVVVHHIASDGWSEGVIIDELAALYSAHTVGVAADLPELPVRYLDYAASHDDTVNHPDQRAQLDQWKSHLSGLAAFELPGDFSRPVRRSGTGSAHHFLIDPGLASAVRDLAGRYAVTPYVVLVSAFFVLLGRYSGLSDVSIGAAVTNRHRENLTGVVGNFVNTVVLRCDLAADPSFAALLAQTRDEVVGALGRQEVPFERVVQEISPTRDLSRNPLFQIMFAYMPAPPCGDWAGLRVRRERTVTTRATFDLTVSLRDHADGGAMAGYIEFSTELFRPGTIRSLARQLNSILTSAVSDPEQPIRDLEILSDGDRRTMVVDWNSDTEPIPSCSLPDLIAAQHPEAPALACGGIELNYGTLVHETRSLAAHLCELGIGAESPVAICLPRSADLIIASLAVMTAGGCYLALDPDYPADRLAFMVSDAKPHVILTRGPAPFAVPAGLTVVDLNQPRSRSAHHTVLPPVDQDQAAALLYTSGSTGTPKAAVISHRNVLAAVTGRRRYAELPESLLLPVSFAFDVFLSFASWTLCTGGQLVLPTERLGVDLDELARLIAQYRVTYLIGPPHLHRALLDHDHGISISRLSAIVTGGEVCPPELVIDLARVAPRLRVINEYGPTEAAWGTYLDATSADLGNGPVPIGVPPANYRVLLLDSNLRQVPCGVEAELYIGGPGLSRGYLRRPDLTARRFVPDPYAAVPGARLYRTGDLAKYRTDGVIEFRGRADQQVKLHGHRIELGEVESALIAHPNLATAVVRHQPGHRRLIGYVVPEHDSVPNGDELRAFLRRSLPEHMVPAAFLAIETVPVTPNGKVDRAALPDPDLETVSAAEADPQDLPRTTAEAIIFEAWSAVLDHQQFGIHDDFFRLGGYSLLAAGIVSRLRGRVPVEVSIRDIFAAPTVAGLAARLGEQLMQQMTMMFKIPEGPAAKPVFAEAPRRWDQGRIVPVDRSQPIPLSFGQQRLWLLDRMHPNEVGYLAPLALRLRGPLHVGALATAVDAVVNRHEVLRTRYELHDGEPVQLIDPPAPFDLLTVELSDGPGATVHDWVEAQLRRPMDLAVSWPVRAALGRLTADDHVLLVVFHHIACDAVSVGLFSDQVARAYEAAVAGRPIVLPALDVQYADYAAANRATVDSPDGRRELAEWAAALDGAMHLELPTDRPRGDARHSRGDTVPIMIAPDLASIIRKTALDAGMTPYMVMLAAFFVVLGRYAGTCDVIVGSPIANRDRPELAQVVGFFGNTVIMRGDLSGDPSFNELMVRVRDEVTAVLGRKDTPFERVVQEVAPLRDLTRNPLFQVMFSYQSDPPRPPRFSGLDVTLVPSGRQAAKFDLLLDLNDRIDGGIAGSIEYATELFNRSTIERLAGHLILLLSRTTTDPQRAISAIPLVADAERELLTADPPELSSVARLHHLVEAQVRRTPDAIAVLHADGGSSYSKLNADANRLAHRLMAAGVDAEEFVGVCLPRGPRLVTALLAVLKAGGAYVPLDPAHPTQRLRHALDTAGARVVVGNADTLDRLRPQVRVDVDEDDSAYPARNPALPGDPRQAAYAIFTSGSTGVPKGVVIPHRGIVNRVGWTIGCHALSPADRVLQKTTVSFDAAGWEFFAPLASGGAVVLASPGAEHDPALIVSDIQAHGVTVLQLVPSMLQLLLDEPTLPGCTSLRLVFSAGEQLRTAWCERLISALDVTLYNTYGPTECSIDATAWRYRPGNWGASTPIGKPIDHIAVRILDAGLQLVPAGVTGELYLTGAGLAHGYLGQPQLTASRFIPDPYSAMPGGRLYRTGDLARRRPDGDIEFVGRVDNEVKIRGVRVDPGEIEDLLSGHDAVARAVVVARPAGDVIRLVAYVVPTDRADIDPVAIRTYLATRLPEQFVPSAVTMLDELPHTASGKVDLNALPEPDAPRRDNRSGYRAPANATEKIVAGVFAELLGMDSVGADADFFAIGGHSLLAIRAALRLRQAFDADVAVSTLLAARTAGRVAESIATSSPATGVELTPTDRTKPLPLSHAQERIWFLHRLDPSSIEYQAPIALRLTGSLDHRALAKAVNAVVARHEVLRTRYMVAGGESWQIVDAPSQLPLTYRDLRGETYPELAANELVSAEAQRPFDLAAEAPLRALAVTVADDDHVLLLSSHHIACDGWSLEVLIGDLAEAYRGEALQPPAIQFADYAAWQRYRSHEQQDKLQWWRRQLAGVAPLDLPTNWPRPPVRSAEGAMYEFEVPTALASAVTQIGAAHQATSFMTMLAAFQALIAGWTGSRDFVVGTPIAARDHAAVEGLVGCFVNTVPLRADLAGSPTFTELLARVRANTTKAYEHAEVPFESIIDTLGTARDLSRTPLVEVMFTLDDAPQTAFLIGDMLARPYPVSFRSAMCDLTLSLRARPDGGYDAELEYATALFHPSTMAALADDMLALLSRAVDDPDCELIIDPVAGLGPAGGELTPTSSVPELFAAAVATTPHAVAVIDTTPSDGWVTLTYAELERAAAELATRLPVDQFDRVAVCLPRGAAALIALLAIMRVGAVYVPIDSDSPTERAEFVVKDTGARVMLTDRIRAATLSGLPVELIDIAERDSDRSGRPAAAVAPIDPAYIIYTSGSTGAPKGVVVSHGSYAGHCLVQAEAYGVGPGERFALTASLTFDASLDQIGAPLVTGATVVVVDPRALVPDHMVDLLGTVGVTLMDITPAYFRELVAVLRPGDRRLSDLRLMSVGGDVVRYDDVLRWRAAGPTATFASMYGPTETTIGCTIFSTADADLDAVCAEDNVPIGHPLRGTGAYVLGPNGRPVPVGAVGELYIGGDRVALSYWNDPVLTADRFTPDPFRNRAGARMYRTGDLVRAARDGAITFVGRADNQVKIRGFRVELGEVEAALVSHDAVHAAAVTTGEPRPGDRRIAAYVVPRGDITAAELASYLRNRLPDYMVPTTWTLMPALPLTANHKVDRRALPAPDWSRSERAETYVVPDGPLQELVAGIWVEVLGLDRVGAHDDFFAIGGNSLLGMRMLLRLADELNLELPLRLIFDEPTVAKLSAELELRLFEGEQL